MLKIVDIHPSATTGGEYLVLQNQGLQTLSLRGWAVCSDAWLSGNPQAAAREMYLFGQDVPIKPYVRVVLFTGEGEEGWCPTTDGKQAYLVYWGRRERVWSLVESVHILHSASSRRVATPQEAVGALAG